MNKWIHRRSNDQPNFSFTLADQRLLRETSPTKNPSIQVFKEIDEEEENKSSSIPKVKVCPKCEEYNLKYLDKLHRYYCMSCGHREEAQRNRRDPKQMDIPFGQRGKYAGYDELDPTTPFLSIINVNKDMDQYDSNPDVELVHSSQDQRIRHYKCKGLPLEALSAVYEKEAEEQQ